MLELWKDIKEYKGYYQVSNQGRVKSLTRTIRFKNGNIEVRHGKILPTFDNHGYLYVRLSKGGKQSLKRVHRLVAMAFIPNPTHLPEVNHIDENKMNNRVDNLEWCNRTGNCNFGTRNKRIGRANTNGKCSKRVAQYDLSGKLIKVWPSMHEAGRHGYNYKSISKCCCGHIKTYKSSYWKCV